MNPKVKILPMLLKKLPIGSAKNESSEQNQ